MSSEESELSEEEEPPVDLPIWCDTYFEELQELYRIFQNSGRKLFGMSFHQFGNFADFVRYIHANTVI